MTGYADANCEDMYNNQFYANAIINILAGSEEQLIVDTDAHAITVLDRGVEFQLRNSPTGVETVIITVNDNDFVDLHFIGEEFGQETITNAHAATVRSYFVEMTGRMLGPRRVAARNRPPAAAIFEMLNPRTMDRLSVFPPTYYLSHDPLFRFAYLAAPRAVATITEYTLTDTLAHIHTLKDQWHNAGGVECRTITGPWQHHFQPFGGQLVDLADAAPTWGQHEPADDNTTLNDVRRALHRISDAVTGDDLHAYLRAVVHGIYLELTLEQIRDCYTYRARRDGYPSFDPLGNPR
ncbi:hypothetical protein [Nocardia brasiliensis]|uniref:hypothetical protein n=1 Tax=Nocardia brasiliensis TaxID=37326 RepID=UPI002458326B|nr:hypothetical protein [Nocardia brasiliensis]